MATEALFGTKEAKVESETLFYYDAKTNKTQLIAHKVRGVMGSSEDLSRVYLVSEEAIAGAKANADGETGENGDPNLYVYEGAAFRFIAALSSSDLFGRSSDLPVLSSPIAQNPYERSSRVSPDGMTAAFESRAKGLTDGYDNTDAVSGEPDAEVYVYDATANAGAGRLSCVSCNPTGARPSGSLGGASCVSNLPCPWAAATLPGWETQLHPTRVLSDNGRRLFFNSFESLVPTDTNGVEDVYEWEAPGEGDCTSSDPTYTAARAGCVRLVSSGQSPQGSEFRDASASGSDVFFTTNSSLLLEDPGLIDIYDARIDGGFPEEAARAECEGEACQGVAAAPGVTTPSSSTARGPGNVKAHGCPKGKHRVRRAGKTRCVAKKRHRAHGGHAQRGAR